MLTTTCAVSLASMQGGLYEVQYMFDRPSMDGFCPHMYKGHPLPAVPCAPGTQPTGWMQPTIGEIRSRWEDMPSGLCWRNLGTTQPDYLETIASGTWSWERPHGGGQKHAKISVTLMIPDTDSQYKPTSPVVSGKIVEEFYSGAPVATEKAYSHKTRTLDQPSWVSLLQKTCRSDRAPNTGKGAARGYCLKVADSFFVPDVHFRLKCGCVLHSRIKIVQGDDSIAAATHGCVYYLEAGDRIEMQFWLLVSRNIYSTCWCKDRNAPHDTCALGKGGGPVSISHTVRLDQTSEEEDPKRIFSSAPWIKFTLVGVKPNDDNDIYSFPLSSCQLPGPVLQCAPSQCAPKTVCTTNSVRSVPLLSVP